MKRTINLILWAGLISLSPFIFLTLSFIFVHLWYFFTSPDWENDMKEIIPIEKIEIMDSNHMIAGLGKDYSAEFLIRARSENDREFIIQRMQELNIEFTGQAITPLSQGVYGYQFPFFKADKTASLFVNVEVREANCFYVFYSKEPCR